MDINKYRNRLMINSRNIARRNSPYDTGLMQDTVSTRPIKNGFIVAWNVFYTRFVNDGTNGGTPPGQKAQHFIEFTMNDIIDMIGENRNSLRFVDRPSEVTLGRRERRRARNTRISKSFNKNKYT